MGLLPICISSSEFLGVQPWSLRHTGFADFSSYVCVLFLACLRLSYVCVLFSHVCVSRLTAYCPSPLCDASYYVVVQTRSIAFDLSFALCDLLRTSSQLPYLLVFPCVWIASMGAIYSTLELVIVRRRADDSTDIVARHLGATRAISGLWGVGVGEIFMARSDRIATCCGFAPSLEGRCSTTFFVRDCGRNNLFTRTPTS
jgi:hypothetical protein